MIPVILESPFRWAEIRNRAYLQRAIRYSLGCGEAPFASHQMYTAALDDNNPEQRQLGILAGRVWWEAAASVIFYLDYGWTSGMLDAFDKAFLLGKPVVKRRIGPNPE